MPYDSKNPKISSIFNIARYLPKSKVDDTPLQEQILSLPHLSMFYGTDANGFHTTYKTTLSDAIKNRIKDPIVQSYKHRHAFFLNRYQSVTQGALAFLTSGTTPVFIVLAGLEILGTVYYIIALLCFPALVELISGIVSLGQSLYFKCKSLSTTHESDTLKAQEYLKDAITRLVLVIPLAVVSAVSIPVDFIQFFTRLIASVVKTSDKTGSLEVINATEQEDVVHELQDSNKDTEELIKMSLLYK